MKIFAYRSLIGVAALGLLLLSSRGFAQTFAYTGDLQHDRQGHTATLLSNGEVLIAGGRDSDNTTNLAELYNPSTGAFTYTGNLNHDRVGHTATWLPSIGKVLITGGSNNDGKPINSAELYDPSTGTFSYTGNLQHDRTSHTATLITNGPLADHVLITGGYNADGDTIVSAELYDPSSGTFSYTGNLQWYRAEHTATLLSDGKTVLIAGGHIGVHGSLPGKGATNTAEVYDSSTGQFTITGYLQHDRHEHQATLLNNGKVLITAGLNNDGNTIKSAELYDPSTGTFAYTGDMQHDRVGHTSTLLTTGSNAGYVLITAGLNNDKNTINSAELYDPSSGTFAYTGKLRHDRAAHTATVLANGNVLITAGRNNDGDTIRKGEIYTPAP